MKSKAAGLAEAGRLVLPTSPMGALDREYFREEGGRATGPPMPPVTKTLLISILAIYFVDMLFLRSAVTEWGAFTIHSGLQKGHLWELITFQFLHGSVGHVIFNAIGLYFFGPWMERWWGRGKYLAFYLLCGVAGALFYTLLMVTGILPERGLLPGGMMPLVGASAGIYGLIVGVAFLNPTAKVQLLFLPHPMSLKTAALGFIGIAVLVILGDILTGGAMFKNSGGEAGHLGGAILGYLLMRQPGLLGRKKGKGKAKAERSKKILRPPEFQRKRSVAPKLRPRSSVDIDAANEVDRVLDKIAKDGLQSLSEDERKILHRAAQAYDEP